MRHSAKSAAALSVVRRSPRLRFLLAVVLAGALHASTPEPAPGQVVTEEQYAGLRYRFIGPEGNRAIAVIGEPGNPLSIYVGAASGGLWRTRDGGVNWTPVFDDESASSVSALAMAPSDPNVIWAGTGETFVIRPAHAMGDGIYRSTDGGDSWDRKGLEATGRIGRIEIDPRNPDVVFACALGHTYGPQPERGVYRTTDGGDSWELVLHVSEDAGCIDLAMDHHNPRILFASFWDVQIDTWGLDSGGPDSGVWRSRDGGDSWERLSAVGRGLPSPNDSTIGKVAVEVAPSNPDRVYVLTEESSPGFYRSDDGGDSWQLVLRNHTINERAPYYTRFGVDPDDENRIYFASVRFSMSVDGGESLVDNPPRGGGDTHDVWIDPGNSHRVMVADDGGLTISMNRGRTFQRVVLPIAQMYHVWTDNEIPYNVYGNRQDGWSYRGPSNSRAGAIPLGLWPGWADARAGSAFPTPPTATSSGRAATIGAGALQSARSRFGRCASGRRRPTAGRRRVLKFRGTGPSRSTSRRTTTTRCMWGASTCTAPRTRAFVGGDLAGPHHQRQEPPAELRRRGHRQPDDL